MKPSFKTILPIALLGLTAVTATHAETSDGNNWNMTDNAGFKVKT